MRGCPLVGGSIIRGSMESVPGCPLVGRSIIGGSTVLVLEHIVHLPTSLAIQLNFVDFLKD